MKFPRFRDTRLIGLSACTKIASMDDDKSERLAILKKVSPFSFYSDAQKGGVYTHVRPETSKPNTNHLHLDIYTAKYLEINRMTKPLDLISKVRFSKQLDDLIGCNVNVAFYTDYVIDYSEILDEFLVNITKFKDDKEGFRIEMTSGSYELTGFGVDRLAWRRMLGDRLYVSLSYAENTVIERDFLTEAETRLSIQFDLLVTGKAFHG